MFPAKNNNLRNRHRGAEREVFFLGHSSNTKKLIWSQSKAAADPFKDDEGRGSRFADDIAKMPGGAAAKFRGPFIAELLCFAKLEKGSGKIV